MNLEKISTGERIKSGKEKLHQLETEGQFVFHGSSHIINELEPRQAYNQNKDDGKMEADGKPAVFATPFAEMAIFRALTNGDDLPINSTSSFGINENGLHFSVTKNLLSYLKNKTGVVYVLDKSQFSVFEAIQCRSYEKVVPVDAVEVTAEDLPDNIEILDNP